MSSPVSHTQPAGLGRWWELFSVERIRGHDAGELLAMAFHRLPESVARRLGLCISS